MKYIYYILSEANIYATVKITKSLQTNKNILYITNTTIVDKNIGTLTYLLTSGRNLEDNGTQDNAI